jgi:hypothetical protein
VVSGRAAPYFFCFFIAGFPVSAQPGNNIFERKCKQCKNTQELIHSNLVGTVVCPGLFGVRRALLEYKGAMLECKESKFDNKTCCLVYKFGCFDDNDVGFDDKAYCFENKEASLDWLNIIVGIRWSLFRKQGVLFGNNDSKLVNSDPCFYSKTGSCKNNNCCCLYNKRCLYYNEGLPDYKNKIVMG